ncbi:MAG: calcium-binding protein [Actinomycetota bacterium]
MRRVIAGATAMLVIGAVGFAVLGGTTVSLATAPTLSVSLHPPAGQPGVKSGDTVTFGGQVSPASALKVGAVIRFVGANGLQCKGFGVGGTQDMNVPQVTWGADGQITGSRKLPGLGADPDEPGDPGCHGGHAFLKVTVREEGTGEETTAASAPVPIDLVGPTVAQARLTAPRELRIVFSEPVHLPSQPDAVVDWEIDGVPPVGISGTDSEKILQLAPPDKDEDATPEVVYRPGAGLLPERETYRDNTANNIYAGGSFQTARDLIPPVIPDIDSLAGKTEASVIANDPTPTVVISNIRAGHHAELYLEATGNNQLDRPGDAFIGQDQADESGAEITAPDLGSDGSYTFYVIARDNALCEPPDDGNGDEETCPNWSGADDGSTRTYTLDRIAPKILFAAVTGPAEVTVGFDEPVLGTNNPTNWTVQNGIVTTVTGSGDRRTLGVAGAVPGANITYTPGDYEDAAGNGLPSFADLLLDALPPVVKVTNPASDQYVSTATYDMNGTAENAEQVHVFRNDDNQPNTPDDNDPSTPQIIDPLVTTPVSGGSWTANVPLLADRSQRFIVRGVRTVNGQNILGPNVQVDAALIQDSIPPTLSLDALPGTAFSGRQGAPPVTIQWTAGDANLQEPPGPIDIEFSPDNGATWEPIAQNHPNTNGAPPCTKACFEWSIFDQATRANVNTKTALIKVTATDRSGRSTSQTSPAFEIDSLLPVFTATILNATQIGVGFSEGVNGLMSPPQWEINDETAGSVQPTGNVSNQMTATLTIGPLASQIDPAQVNTVRYTPLVPLAALEDHVGNPIIPVGTGGGPSGGGGGNGGFTAQANSANACTILGTDGPDVLVGTEGPDIICPSNGDDHIDALGGDDIILAGLGAKTINGGPGNDEINGGPDNDTLNGGPGSDMLTGDVGNDSLLGGDGDDILHGGDGNDSADGGSGRDVIEGQDGNDDLTGGSDLDHMSGGNGDDSISGGDGDDRLAGDSGNDRILGGNGTDVIDGGEGNDTLEGEGDNDEISGGNGRDELLGDGGNDQLNGDDGNDRVSGDSGNDKLEGGQGNDRIYGGEGNDQMNGSVGNDLMLGQDGNDKLFGSNDNDTLNGGTGRDMLSGESGRDKLLGSSHRDKLLGGSQRDRLDGGSGGDYCNGGAGPDSKVGCEGGPAK